MKKIICTLLNLILVSICVAQVQISIPDTSADTESYVTIPVKVSDLTNLNIISYQIDLSYESRVVTPTEISVNNTLTESWGQLVYNLETPGLIKFGAYDVEPIKGKGILVNIIFKIIGQPFDSTALIFKFYEFSHESITVKAENGGLKVNSNLINVTISTNVQDNVKIIVDDIARSMPYETTWKKGSVHKLAAPSPQLVGTDTQYLFASWSDGGAQSHTVSSVIDTKFIANFSTQYFLTIHSEYGNPQGQGWYDSGAVAAFSIENQIFDGEYTRHHFVSWIGIGKNSYTGTQLKNSVIMTNPIIQYANWSTEYYLKIDSPYGYPFGEGWYSSGATASFGIDSTAIVTATEQYFFQSWTGQGNGSYTGENPRDNVMMKNPIIEVANWKVEYYVKIGSQPEGIIDIPGSGWYPLGNQFTTIAVPDTVIKNSIRYIFKAWLVNRQVIPGNPITVNVYSALTIVANYENNIDITVTTNIGAGTQIIVDGIIHDAPFMTTWTIGELHTISVPEFQYESEDTRYAFKSWNDGGERTHTVKPLQNETYTAVLQKQHYLEVKTNPAGLLNIEGTSWYNKGESVALNAPLSGKIDHQTYRFKLWAVDNDTVMGNSIAIIMNSPKTAIANYEKAYRIAGTISEGEKALADVRLIVTGIEADTVYSNQGGSYEFTALFKGNYEITPFKYGYRFEPENRHYGLLMQDYDKQNFVAIDTLMAVDLQPDSKIPADIVLNQNYPNPFNNTTIIQFKLPQKTTVELKIYNLLGQPIKTLISKQQQAGDYSISWDGKDDLGSQLPSGIYFYKLITNDNMISKKMIMLE